MLHDIFEITKKSKKKPERIPLIVADIHEKNSLVIAELCNSQEIIVKITHLEIADYIIGDVAIERKTVSDLVSSMISKRLLQQLQNMQKYSQKLLIIEGDLNEIYEKNNALSKAIRGLLLSIATNHNTPVIQTSDYKDTSLYLITLAKQQLKPKTRVSLHSKIPKTIQEQKEYILESFPNIGQKKSEKLLKKFKTLEKVFNASEEELKEILKSKSENFREILLR